MADLSGNTNAADVLLIIAAVLAGLQAVLAIVGRQLEEALMPAAVALLALGLALL